MTGDANHVLINRRGLRDPLSFERAFDLEDAISQSGGFLEVLLSSGGLHLCAEFVQQFPVVSFQELPDLPNDLVILLL
jgi:hypothetical protein